MVYAASTVRHAAGHYVPLSATHAKWEILDWP